MKKEKDNAGSDKAAEDPASPKTGEEKKMPKVQLTKKLRKKLDKLRGKDPNIYPLW